MNARTFRRRFIEEENRGPSNGYKSVSEERASKPRKITAAQRRRERVMADIAAFMAD